MTNDSDRAEEHVNGTRYGGKILSVIPAPEGWFVGTQVKQKNRKTGETDHGDPKVGPLIAWALVDAMFRDGARATRLEPMFLSDTGSVTHEGEFRWMEGAGNVDPDGWSITVSVQVIPNPSAVADLPAYGVGPTGLASPGETSS